MFLTSEKFNKSAFEFNSSIHRFVTLICTPLFQNTCIKHFRYMRMYKNYKYLSIGTCLPYLEQYLQNLKEPGKVFEPDKIYSSPSLLTTRSDLTYFLWPNKYSEEVKDPLFDLLYHFDIWNGFTISRCTDDYVETWSFATSKNEESTTQFYINNLPLLDSFVMYFQERISDFIKEINDDKLAVFQTPFNLNCKINDVKPNLSDNLVPSNSLSEIFNPLNNNNKISSLSKRELECLYHIVRGHATKKVANIMGISPRTIEAHINSIKRKTKANYKTDLSSLLTLEEIVFLKETFEKKTF